ncbi:MAG TPA: PKD domain-containing protein [Rhodocyclaceae bacterium]|nr:PKD domain-containing protein [Rhodocyclaceae bacterium]
MDKGFDCGIGYPRLAAPTDKTAVRGAATMWNKKEIRVTVLSGMACLALLFGICLTGCGGGGGGGGGGGSTNASIPGGTTPPPATGNITAFASAGTNLLQVSSNNTLNANDVVTISGSSTPAYNGTFTVVSATSSSFVITAAFTGTNASSSWTRNGGVLPACTTTGATGAITLAATPSRIVGVAPLAVFFDASATTATATTRPFHELEYSWTFGDVSGSPVSGTTWNTGSRAGSSSRNMATGPIAAHLFETPGAYTISLTVKNSTNTVSNSCVQIAVQDPNVVFSGTNTICFSGSGTFTNCPSGAQQITQSNFSTALSTYAGTGKRLLFHSGETFVATSQGSITNNGPMTIGKYDTGAAPVISESPADSVKVLAPTTDANDLRIMDLDIEGGGTNTLGTGYGMAIFSGSSSPALNYLTVLRLKIANTHAGIIITGTGASWIKNSLLQDNTITGMNSSGGVGIYGMAINSAYLGNIVGPFNSSAEHLIRLQPGIRVVIANNTVSTPGTSGKQNLTVRAIEHTPDAIDGASYPYTDTQYVLISDNYFNGGGTTTDALPAATLQPFQVGPASNNQNNWISDIIAERNWIVFGSRTQEGFQTEASNVTVRSNICNSSGGSNTSNRSCYDTYHTNTAGVLPPDNVRFYNNTCYQADSSTQIPVCIALVYSGSGTTNAVIQNNLAYAPNATTPKLLGQGAGVTGTTANNNSSDAQVLSTNPLFSNGSGSFSLVTDFKPTGATYVVGGGASVPVWSDFFLTSWYPSWDIGAAHH